MSSQIINSRYCNHFVTISTLLYDKGVVVPQEWHWSERRLPWEKMKIYLQVLTSFIKHQIWLFHVVVLQTTAKKWTKVKNARAGRAKLFFCPLNMQICDVLVAVAVSLLKFPCNNFWPHPIAFSVMKIIPLSEYLRSGSRYPASRIWWVLLSVHHLRQIT